MRKFILISIIFIVISSCGQNQNKSSFEKNGIKIRFKTTLLGEISDNKFELIKDMNFSGVFLFIPDKKSVVLRHDNGNDELLSVIKSQKTGDNNYVFECNKERILVISPSEKIVSYSIENNPSVFMFPIDEDDISKLKSVLMKY